MWSPLPRSGHSRHFAAIASPTGRVSSSASFDALAALWGAVDGVMATGLFDGVPTGPLPPSGPNGPSGVSLRATGSLTRGRAGTVEIRTAGTAGWLTECVFPPASRSALLTNENLAGALVGLSVGFEFGAAPLDRLVAGRRKRILDRRRCRPGIWLPPPAWNCLGRALAPWRSGFASRERHIAALRCEVRFRRGCSTIRDRIALVAPVPAAAGVWNCQVHLGRLGTHVLGSREPLSAFIYGLEALYMLRRGARWCTLASRPGTSPGEFGAVLGGLGGVAATPDRAACRVYAAQPERGGWRSSVEVEGRVIASSFNVDPLNSLIDLVPPLRRLRNVHAGVSEGRTSTSETEVHYKFP